MIEINNVSYTYPGAKAKALSEVNFKATNGTLSLITGRSGSGKTTLSRLINCLCPAYYGGTITGQVLVDGQPQADLSDSSCRVGTLFQDPERQFFALNVEDEIAFALEWRGLKREEIKARVDEVIELFDLQEIASNPINSLSEGQKQKVGLAQIIALGVKNIILDEPSANLDPESTLALAATLKKLKAQGYCIVVFDHRLYYLKNVADQVMVFDEGKVVAQGDYSILNNDALRKKHGLRQVLVEDCRKSYIEQDKAGEACLIGENITFAYKKNAKHIFENYNFRIKPGVSVLLGDNGVGKTTLCRLIFGLEKAQSGKIFLTGDLKDTSYNNCSIVLQNSDYQLHMKTVAAEIKTTLSLSGLNSSDENVIACLKQFNLDDLISRHPQSLSGGQKQRLVLACALAKKTKILILDEPTSGLDGANMLKIKKMLADFTSQGGIAIIITHDLELMDKDYNYLHLTHS